jgi:hypothetical protein
MTSKFWFLRTDPLDTSIKLALMILLLVLPAVSMNAVLENQHIRLEISEKDGSIVRLLEKSSQTEFISNVKQSRLFRLGVPRPGNLARRIDSRDQTVEPIEVSNGSLTLRFRDLQVSQRKYIFQEGVFDSPEPRLPIEISITFRLNGPHIIATMQVVNHSIEEITDVIFPWISGLNPNLDEKPSTVIVPALSNRVLTQIPNFLLGERGLRYPGILATAWLNFGGANRSLALDSHSGPETQDAILSLTPHGIAENSPSFWEQPDFPYIGWGFFPHIAGQSAWTSPEIFIHLHASDWHTVADEHREWYRGQLKAPRPSAFGDEIGFATYRLKRSDDTVNWRYDQIPELSQAAKAAGFSKVVIDGWRQHEGPANKAPFEEFVDPRLGGAAALKPVIESLHQQGTELIFALHPALINTAAEKHSDEVVRWTVKSRRRANQPQPSYTFYSTDYPYLDLAGHYWASLDPSTASTDFLLSEGKRLRDQYGFRNLFLRGIGLQSFLSYNKERPVAPQMVFVAGYDKLLGGLQKLLPGFLMMEGWNDLVNPYSEAGYTWEQTENSEVLALSMPGTPFSTDVEALEFGRANAAFARKILINLIVDGGDGTVKRYPEFARHLNGLRLLKRASAPYYTQAEFRDQEGLARFTPTQNVIVCAFRNRTTGQRGIVVANLESTTTKVNLILEDTSGRARLLRVGGPQQIELQNVDVQLGPYEVTILCVDPEQAAGK